MTPCILIKFTEVSEVAAASIINSFTSIGVNCLIKLEEGAQAATSISFFLAQQPPVGHGFLVHEVSISHTTTHHSRQDSSGRVISLSQRPLPDNTLHSQQTDIHDPGRIRTHNLSRRTAEDLGLRPRGHWDPATTIIRCLNLRGN